MNRPECLLCCVSQHLKEARLKHGPIQSPHEGYAVIKEELDELWDAVKSDDLQAACKEAFQVAASALRFVDDLYEIPNGSRR